MMAVRPTPVPHIPVLIRPLIAAVSPVTGHWVDGTFGAGGYTRALLEAGATHVTAIDRDPLAFELAAPWADDRITMVEDVFSNLDAHVSDVDGVVLDLGVSSMQLDRAERGFSFQKDGPLDMRMSQSGPTAADIIADATEAELADILYVYGEERASRRIARAIKAAWPLDTTLALAEVIEGQLPRAKPGQSHPATRSFQALRIAVNAEYDELYQGLMAAERALKPGGALAVVTFHSVEDRMVKRFLQSRAGATGNANRFAPETSRADPAFTLVSRKAIQPDEAELAENPRARSALLRVARRTDAPAGEIDAKTIGVPSVKGRR
ncbi:16S rRNA (cytosine(1402)-N(4))-methyltransferase RsmH [Pseudaestuariivita atlantica]|uniref:Ribosomal RNA small subunit methyltransferase H n=1 Tax=Pseudaestuariivita atlantica TaxID=1317121 RepID=A0A0L1JUQ0_9RHOB|nr:16S rRNA (cytosine(1402)-N(4))-methyltransferase RsmH [Pseudaestuariivita atlantica]KNG95138.1 16S rRNA methyltransferase [Pseudaestuariivita atlantica]